MFFYRTENWCLFPNQECHSDSDWEKWDKAYSEYWGDISKYLPKTFLKQYESNNGFHDFQLKELHIYQNNENSIKITLLISMCNEEWLITYSGVQNYTFNIPHDKKWCFGRMEWLTDEFHLLKDETWVHRIMCDGNCEIQIHFKKVGIKHIKVTR